MENLLHDFRCGFRALARKPGFTVVAVITLALGIGPNAALFSVLHAVLLRPFPVREPEHLMVLWERNDPQGYARMNVSPPNFRDWRERLTSFEDMAAYAFGNYYLGTEEELVRTRTARVTGPLFKVLGVRPLLGRTFNEEEMQPDKGRAVILSYSLWQSRFGGRPGLVGKKVEVDHQPFTVVGIMPPGFHFPPKILLEGTQVYDLPEMWVPLGMSANAARNSHFLIAIGRLRPNVSREAARAEVSVVARALAGEYPDSNRDWDVLVAPLASEIVGNGRTILLILFGAVGCVLLIACVNIANLLLARGVDRQKEFALRAVLGAGPFRLVSHTLSESVLLSTIGGGVGLLFAFWAIDVLIAAAPPGIPRLEETALNGTVVLTTFGLALATGIAAGFLPAIQQATPNLQQWLKEGGRASSRSGRSRLRSFLVVVEVAASLVLLVGAVLLARSFWYVLSQEPGFRTEQVFTLRTTVPPGYYAKEAELAVLYGQMEAAINAIPGVRAAGFVNELPLAADRQGTTFDVEGEPKALPGRERVVNFTFVTPGYFEAAGIPLVEGRFLRHEDTAAGEEVVVVNRELARRYFGSVSPIGRRLFIGFSTQTPRRVVGVVGDVLHDGLDKQPFPGVSAPYFQVSWSSSMSLAVRSEIPTETLKPTVIEKIRSVVSRAPVFEIRTLSQILSASLAPRRFATLLVGGLAALALTLAMVGMYGVLAYAVSQRTQEIGVRVALGARPADIVRLVLGDGLRLAATGIAAGLLVVVPLLNTLRSLVTGVSVADPTSYVLVGGGLLLVASLATYVPARRAARVEPLEALRYE